MMKLIHLLIKQFQKISYQFLDQNQINPLINWTLIHQIWIKIMNLGKSLILIKKKTSHYKKKVKDKMKIHRKIF